MAEAFAPKFVDLVRQTSRTNGESDFVLDTVPAGYTAFGDALSTGDKFYYSAIGIDKPAEAEVGRGTLNADGSIARDPLSGTKTSFTGGTKAISLVVASPWFADNGAYKASHAGALARSVNGKLGERLSVKDFGAVGDGVTDDTAAFNAALAALGASRTAPPGYAGWGMGALYVPRGKYLVNGTISVTSPIGVRIQGDGAYATSIIRTVDTGDLFALTTYIHVRIEDLSLIHSSATAKSGWTTTAFALNGAGGGRQLQLSNVTTRGFAKVIEHRNTLNEDTTLAQGCTFEEFHTFLDGQNSQAVESSFIHCSWVGATVRGFYVAGHGQTLIASGNVAMDGPLIAYRDVASKYDRSGFTLINVKFEWRTIDSSAGSPPKIIDCDGIYVQANLSMIDCTVKGGSSIHADARWAKIGAGKCRIDIQGGTLGGKLELVKFTTHRANSGSYIRFRGVELTDPSQWVWGGTTAGAAYPPVSLHDCVIGTQNNVNMTLSRGIGVPNIDPARTLVLGPPTLAYPTYGGGSTTLIDHDFYGEKQYLKSLKFIGRIGAAFATARTVSIHSDVARTQLIATANMPTTSLANTIVDLPIPAGLVLSALYLSVTCPASAPTMTGMFIADIVAV